MEEIVVLVDKNNNQIGTASKATVHTKNTPLHRGFSIFIFNSQGALLLTKRASTKKTFPGVWTNTVCGHPGVGESATDAATRRLKDELGMNLRSTPGVEARLLRVVKKDYRYRFADANGIVENEICPILVGYSDDDPKPNAQEVDDWKWMDWKEVLQDMKDNPTIYSPWSREEAVIVDDTIFNS